MYYLDENIKDLVRIFDQNERKDYLRLDLNENPGGLPQEFITEVLKDVTPQFVAQYTETLHFTQVIADHIGTDISHLCITNGSAEAIRYVIQAFTSPKGRIVGVVPSYFMFQVYSEMYGRNFVKIPYNEDLTISINNIVKELTKDTQMLILLNPNNPMGNVYSDEEFEKLFKICQEKEITLLVDEAYHYFYPKTFIKYGIKELLDFSRKKNIKNVLYISSSEVYGQTVKKSPFKENEYGYLDITNPRNAYASSKRASETLCVSYYKQYGVKSNIVRPGHIYGPTASMADSRVSSFFAYAAAEGKDLEIKSEGKQIRSYCYVLDCASAIITVLLKGKPSEVYNISNENSIMSIKDIASLYAEEGAVNVIFNLPSKQEKSAFNPMENSSLDNTKLRMIGWKGLFDSKMGTSHTIKILRGE